MSYSVKGIVLVINDVQQISESFKKREFVLEYAENPEYPEPLKLETIQDKTSLLDPLKVGDTITAHFNLKGRKWTDREGVDKYFNTLQCWKIETGVQVASVPTGMATAPAQTETPTQAVTDDSELDDLPF